MRPINATVTQGFGANPATYAQFGLKGHNGWDFSAPYGSKVYAPEAGTAYTSYDEGGYGNVITLKGRSGWEHKLAHLAKFGVTGAVSEGAIVGYVDSTGFSTGNHLHWTTKPPGANISNGYFGAVNPSEFLKLQSNQGDSYMGVSAKAWSAEAVRGFIFEVTGNRHTLADINEHHVGKSRAKIYSQFFPSAEYKAALNKAYQTAYGRNATAAELSSKVSGQVGIPKVKDQLLASLGKG